MDFTESEKELVCNILKEIKMNELCNILERAYPKADGTSIKEKINQVAEIIYKSDPDEFEKIEARRKEMDKNGASG